MAELSELFKDGKFVGKYEDYGRVLEALAASAQQEVVVARSGEANFQLFTSRDAYSDKLSRLRRRTRLNSLNYLAQGLPQYAPAPLPDTL